jgi:hypothetical protein
MKNYFDDPSIPLPVVALLHDIRRALTERIDERIEPAREDASSLAGWWGELAEDGSRAWPIGF